MTVMVSEEQKKRIEQQVKEGVYTSKGDYVRSMLEAGESRLATLDPRSTETTETQATHDTGESAAQSLSDAALVNQLPDGEGNKERFDEAMEKPLKEFENTIANRLKELVQDENSPVDSDGKGNYWREDQ